MIDEKKLAHAFDILNGSPCRGRDDLVDTLGVLSDFHKSLCNEYYDENRVIARAREFLDLIDDGLVRDPELKNDLLRIENLDADSRKHIVRSLYDIIKKYAAPDFDDLKIEFEDKDTCASARGFGSKKTIVFYNVGTNPQMTKYKRVLNIVVHEFIHLLQGAGRATFLKSAGDLANKYYCSFVTFDKSNPNDVDIKKLADECWRNNLLEKEAIAIGEYIEDNLDINRALNKYLCMNHKNK